MEFTRSRFWGACFSRDHIAGEIFLLDIDLLDSITPSDLSMNGLLNSNLCALYNVDDVEVILHLWFFAYTRETRAGKPTFTIVI